MAGMYPQMTDAQRAGLACPWCRTPTADRGVDLGESYLPRANVVLHPFACVPCTVREAAASYDLHRRMCTTCAFDGEHCCPDARTLRALGQGTGLADERREYAPAEPCPSGGRRGDGVLRAV